MRPKVNSQFNHIFPIKVKNELFKLENFYKRIYLEWSSGEDNTLYQTLKSIITELALIILESGNDEDIHDKYLWIDNFFLLVNESSKINKSDRLTINLLKGRSCAWDLINDIRSNKPSGFYLSDNKVDIKVWINEIIPKQFKLIDNKYRLLLNTNDPNITGYCNITYDKLQIVLGWFNTSEIEEFFIKEWSSSEWNRFQEYWIEFKDLYMLKFSNGGVNIDEFKEELLLKFKEMETNYGIS